MRQAPPTTAEEEATHTYRRHINTNKYRTYDTMIRIGGKALVGCTPGTAYQQYVGRVVCDNVVDRDKLRLLRRRRHQSA